MSAENTQAIHRLLEAWRFADDVKRGRPVGDLVARASAYLLKEPPAVSGQRGHDRCFHVACVLVKDFGLSEEQAYLAIQHWNATCEPPWSEGELRHKIADAAKQPGPVGRLAGVMPVLNGHHANGNGAPAPPRPPIPSADNSSDPLDQDATAADLILASITITWGWEKWLPRGVLSVLASEPGIGKTRFCADLARRVYHGLNWPDGVAATFPQHSTTLWVPADNQHSELGTLVKEFGIPPEALYLNATRRNPFAGTLLDDEQDLRDFEARIARVKPALVFVDTSLNATDKSAHRPEDAKAFFVPLQQIAARQAVIMLCVTHLNAAGKPLGRRIMGQARLVMQLERPDPGQEHRRKLHVVKSNSLYPAPLGVTMGSSGNEYDTNPPAFVGEEESRAANDPRTAAAREWLAAQLADAPRRVSEIRTAADLEGITVGSLYRARDGLGVVEYVVDRRKWWRLQDMEPHTSFETIPD